MDTIKQSPDRTGPTAMIKPQSGPQMHQPISDIGTITKITQGDDNSIGEASTPIAGCTYSIEISNLLLHKIITGNTPDENTARPLDISIRPSAPIGNDFNPPIGINMTGGPPNNISKHIRFQIAEDWNTHTMITTEAQPTIADINTRDTTFIGSGAIDIR